MIVTQTEYLSKLAEFNKNLVVSGLRGSVEIHFCNEKAKDYKVITKISQKDLEK